jgi:predicted nucleic acid-binding protein
MSPGRVLSFLDSNLPSEIILDTNFIVNIAFQFTTLHADHITDCARFAKRLYAAHATLYVPEWCINELCHITYRAKLFEDAKKQLGDGKKWKELYDNNPAILKKYHATVEAMLRAVEEITKRTRLKENLPNIRKKAFNIIKHIDICPTDAYIVATALLNDVENIATVNVKDFQRVAKNYPLNIYLPDHMVNTIKASQKS